MSADSVSRTSASTYLVKSFRALGLESDSVYTSESIVVSENPTCHRTGSDGK
jgi:hypothetical protein